MPSTGSHVDAETQMTEPKAAFLNAAAEFYQSQQDDRAEIILGALQERSVPNHKSRGHSVLGASGAKRWIHCPGSVRLTEGLPDTRSEAAEKGTAVHEVGNMALEQRLPASHWIGSEVHGFVITEAMAESCQVYLDTCAEYMDGDWEYWVERNFSLEKLNPPTDMFGTSDFTAINRRLRKMVVCDYKNGFIYVDAEGNEQLRYYALGALFSFDEMPAVDEIEVVIVQPNSTGDAVKRDTFTIVDLIEWSMDLMDHARATLEPDAPLSAGDWCMFCKAKGKCPEQARAAAEAAQEDFADFVEVAPSKELVVLPQPTLLTDEQLGFLVAYKLPRLLEFAKAATEAAHALLNRGVEVPYLKLVPMRASESWIDEATIVDDLQDMFGLPEDKAYAKRKPASPAQARGALVEMIVESRKKAGTKITKKDAEAEAKSLLAALVKKESSGNHVAPIEDSRPQLTASVHEDFAPIEGPQ